MKGERSMVPREKPRSYYGRPGRQGAGLDLGDPDVLLHRRLAGAATVLAYGAQLAGQRRLARRSWLRALAGVIGEPGAADLRPRPARALPQHAARLQDHLADERRLVDPRRRTAASSPPPRSPPSCDRAAARAAGERARGRRRRAGADHLHGGARRQQRDPRLERGAPPSALRLRRQRRRQRRRRGYSPAGRRRRPGPAPGDRRRSPSVAGEAMERSLGALGEPYESGEAGGYGRIGSGLTPAARRLALGPPPRRRRRRRRAADRRRLRRALGRLPGGLRLGRDPEHTVGPQRSRMNGRGA